jgi:hypothetical protein
MNDSYLKWFLVSSVTGNQHVCGDLANGYWFTYFEMSGWGDFGYFGRSNGFGTGSYGYRTTRNGDGYGRQTLEDQK